jgi:hypothetical protein
MDQIQQMDPQLIQFFFHGKLSFEDIFFYYVP